MSSPWPDIADLVDADRPSGPSAIGFALERDVIVARGTDVVSYLQGQLSQDIEAVAVGETARSLLLQPQGKVDAWFRVHRRSADEFWLDVDRGYGDAAVARLERFKLRVDVELEVRPVTALALRGPGADELARSAVSEKPLVALAAGWGDVTGIDLFDPNGWRDSSPVTELAGGIGAALVPADLGELVRIRQGLPAMGSELGASTIPAAAGVVEGSVDFDKGCYVGQELVARVDSRGNNTPTRLCRFRTESGQPLLAGTELYLDGEVAAKVTSSAAWPDSPIVLGLAYLYRRATPPVTLFTADQGGIEVFVDTLIGIDA